MPDYDYQSDTRTFSQVLEDIGAKDDPKLYLGEMVNAFGERGFGALMVLFGLLNALPLPPGTTSVLGLPLLLMSLQLLFRADQVWLPKWALKRSIDRGAYRTGAMRVVKPIRMLERLTKPRLSIMTSEVSEILIGLAGTVLSIILILPIWGGNMVPALIMATFGFGLMQRDGIVVLVGWLGVAGFCVFAWIAWEVIYRVFMMTWTWLSGLVA